MINWGKLEKWNPKLKTKIILTIWVPKLSLSYQRVTSWNIEFQMVVAFILMTKNTKLQYLRFHECCHYRLNDTNNTQMLHYEHEDDSSHMVHFIKKIRNKICCIGLYISYNPIWYFFSIIYNLLKFSVFLVQTINYTIWLVTPIHLVFSKSFLGELPHKHRHHVWRFIDLY